MALPLKGNLGYLQNLVYESFLTILRYYVDLNCFIITTGKNRDWLAMHYHRRPASLFDYEKKYRYFSNWDHLTDPLQDGGYRKGQPQLVETLGFYDLLTPIQKKGKWLGTILSGAFADRIPTYDHLRASWKKLTGKDASPEDPEFRDFVKVLLETPVLEGRSFKAFEEAMKLFAAMIADEAGSNAPRRIHQLILEVFSKEFPHSYWLDWALGRPTSQATPLWDLKAQEMPWLREEIGIRRLPTTVLAVVPAGPDGKKRDAVEEMLRIDLFQRRAFRFAKTLPETVGGKLENYGALFVTSASPGLPRLAQKRQLMETAEKLRQFASRELGGPVRVGIGEAVAPGESLWVPFRQAVWALHLQKRHGRESSFYRYETAPLAQGAAEITRLLLDLKGCFESASFSDMEKALDGYLKQVLSLSFQDPEQIRWHLHYAIVQAGEAVKGGPAQGQKGVSGLVEELVLRLERATTTQEMIVAFKDAMGKLTAVSHDPKRSVEFSSMGRIREHLEGHFHKPQKVVVLARLAGVSPATFSRWFKKANGVGLETYLQDLRLNEARRLLKSGSLPIEKVAHTSGFKSRSYFVRLFRQKAKMTPTQFRERSKTP